jgi:hypothetical protein
MHYMILISKKMMSQKKLGEIKLVPYNKPHSNEIIYGAKIRNARQI